MKRCRYDEPNVVEINKFEFSHLNSLFLLPVINLQLLFQHFKLKIHHLIMQIILLHCEMKSHCDASICQVAIMESK